MLAAEPNFFSQHNQQLFMFMGSSFQHNLQHKTDKLYTDDFPINLPNTDIKWEYDTSLVNSASCRFNAMRSLFNFALKI